MKSNILQEFTNILVQHNLKMGLGQDQAERNAVAVICALSEKYKGELIYFPASKASTRDRDERLYAAHVFGGVPLAVAAKRCGVSKTSSYRILRRMRAELQK